MELSETIANDLDFPISDKEILRTSKILKNKKASSSDLVKNEMINPRSLGGGGVKLNHPLDFFRFKFLLLDRLSKALAQLFLVCEHIF